MPFKDEMPIRIKVIAGSHLPILMKLLSITDGPVLELGSGIFSTTFLHWACHPFKRRLVTYENNPEWFMFVNKFAGGYHEVNCITDWDSIDISFPWSIALVDHQPEPRRTIETRRLHNAEYVVVHDTNNRVKNRINLGPALREYKYRYDNKKSIAHTTLLSDKHNLSSFGLSLCDYQ